MGSLRVRARASISSYFAGFWVRWPNTGLLAAGSFQCGWQRCRIGLQPCEVPHLSNRSRSARWTLGARGWAAACWQQSHSMVGLQVQRVVRRIAGVVGEMRGWSWCCWGWLWRGGNWGGPLPERSPHRQHCAMVNLVGHATMFELTVVEEAVPFASCPAPRMSWASLRPARPPCH